MTHTLAEIRAEYDRLDALCAADTSGVRLEVSPRMHRTYGKCCYGPQGPTRTFRCPKCGGLGFSVSRA